MEGDELVEIGLAQRVAVQREEAGVEPGRESDRPAVPRGFPDRGSSGAQYRRERFSIWSGG
jgi:hypothetical protein